MNIARCEICQVDFCEHTQEIDKQRINNWLVTDSDNADIYSQFLHDNDFEYWQPVCYIQSGTKDYQRYTIEAHLEYMRALWIKMRLLDYGSADWQHYCAKWNFAYDEMQFLIRMYERRYREPFKRHDLNF